MGGPDATVFKHLGVEVTERSGGRRISDDKEAAAEPRTAEGGGFEPPQGCTSTVFKTILQPFSSWLLKAHFSCSSGISVQLYWRRQDP